MKVRPCPLVLVVNYSSFVRVVKKKFKHSSVAGRPVAPVQPFLTHHAHCAADRAGLDSLGFSGVVDA